MNSTEWITAHESNSGRYQAVVRISEAIAACREPEELARTLADEIGSFLYFDHLYIAVLKENSAEIEYLMWGKNPVPGPDLPIKEWPMWAAMVSGETKHIIDFDTEEGYPRFKQWAKEMGLGTSVRVPLTTPHRRLGVFGISRDTVNPFREEEINFLRLIGRVVAFAVDDGLNLRRSQQQNHRLELLLNLTNRITSNLEFRQLLREIAAGIRGVMQCDSASICLLEPGAEQYRLYALDFPGTKGFLTEEELRTTFGAARRVVQTLKPIILNDVKREDFAPEVYEKVVAEGFKKGCLIPLIYRGRALGFIMAGRKTEDSFTSEDAEFLNRASGPIAIAVENSLAYQQISELRDKLAQEKIYLEDEIRVEMNFSEIIGDSPALRKVLKSVETVAPTDSTVLIQGETGTGKELIARAIHDLSPRRPKGFVKLNCAAIPTGLLESELFGHEKGAFTGAIAQRIGRFEVANGGTIFLDEIGEIPLELQTKLLRVLQEREFERLGSSRTLRTDARLIAATNRDLQTMVGEQRFRSDLFYRLNVFPVHVPSLRERHSDIPLLVRHFAQQFSKRMNKVIDTIPTAMMDALCRYHWPGNIRELQNVIERAMITSAGPALNVDIADLKVSNSASGVEKVNPVPSTNGGLHETLEETERQQILKALEHCKWVVGGPHGAAAHLQINRSTLQVRMRKLGIARESS